MTAFFDDGEDRGAAEFDVGDEHVDVGAQVQRGVKLVEGRGGADDHELVAVREHGAQGAGLRLAVRGDQHADAT